MDFAEWEPVYAAILADFGFDRAADERARDLLADLTDPFDLDGLDLSGTVAVAGGAPRLARESDLELAREADSVVAASTAADVLARHGIGVDCMVTDLDKNPGTVVSLTERGTPVATHAHGDNIEQVREVVPRCRGEAVIPTAQCGPAGPVVNPGGFTDGDRAAFLADACGADRLVFPGWEFDDPDVNETKARKLAWAERLLYWLEWRREERFDVLDGRRDGIDTSALPVK